MIARHFRQGIVLAPDQIFSAGYRDGMNHSAPHPQFRKNLQYFKGYAEGSRGIPGSPKLIAFCQSHSLDTALLSIQQWEQDQQRFSFGQVALGHRNGWWLVLVSQDLHDVALPF